MKGVSEGLNYSTKDIKNILSVITNKNNKIDVKLRYNFGGSGKQKLLLLFGKTALFWEFNGI